MSANVTSWAKAVTSRFAPDVAHVVVAFDPDRLLAEETVLSLLGEQGFEVAWFEDFVKFWYAYEA